MNQFAQNLIRKDIFPLKAKALKKLVELEKYSEKSPFNKIKI